jgi:hypothetical protein
MPDEDGALPSVVRIAPDEWAVMPEANEGMPYANIGMLCPFLGALCAYLATLHPFLGIPYAFAATPCEGEDAIHEELRQHRALHGVPDPFRERGSEYLGSPSLRETMPPAYVGMRRGLTGTPPLRPGGRRA